MGLRMGTRMVLELEQKLELELRDLMSEKSPMNFEMAPHIEFLMGQRLAYDLAHRMKLENEDVVECSAELGMKHMELGMRQRMEHEMGREMQPGSRGMKF